MTTKSLFFRLFLSVILLVPTGASAQVTIGSATQPIPYAILELDASYRIGGFRFPQLSGQDIVDFRNSIENAYNGISPRTEGLVFYNLDDNCFEFWNGNRWEQLCGDYVQNQYLTNIVTNLTNRIESLLEQIDNIEVNLARVRVFTGRSHYPSIPSRVRRGLEVSGGTERAPAATGINLHVVSTGYFFNMVGTGTLVSSAPQSNRERFYLFVSGDTCDPDNGVFSQLRFHQGLRIQGTLWINGSSRTLYFDQTGIYFYANSGSNISGTFNFTQSLILPGATTSVKSEYETGE